MKHTILIADDESSSLKVILNYLTESGQDYSVIAAPNGEIACKLARERQPDVILMDWNMPVMSGIEALDKLKSDPSTNEIPILMVTARASSEDLQLALDKGAMDYIRKPIDKIELLARVKSALKLYDSFKTIKQQQKKIEEINVTLKKLSN
ncbi:MAG: response regulator [Bacteroidetes bacterium]|nr:response regulator [Bacteroidota bacterium]